MTVIGYRAIPYVAPVFLIDSFFKNSTDLPLCATTLYGDRERPKLSAAFEIKAFFGDGFAE